MSIIKQLLRPDDVAIRLLNPLQPVFALAARCYVSLQFLRSGYLKVTSWDATLYLFENEYHTPLLPPHVAAYAGAFGELFFPTLLVVGFLSRLGALGLSAVNIVAVISYQQVLLADGSEAALAQHILWGTLLLFLCIYGSGSLSVDQWLRRRSRQTESMASA